MMLLRLVLCKVGKKAKISDNLKIITCYPLYIQELFFFLDVERRASAL